MKRKPHKLLYRSLDKDLSPEEAVRLVDALDNSLDLEQEKHQLLSLRADLGTLGNEQFSDHFSDSVMDKVIRMQFAENDKVSRFSSLSVVFRPIALAALVTIAALVPFNMYIGYELEENRTEAMLALATDVILLEEMP